jgi:hydrogenase large subunit
MKGIDPRDAHFITSRICGICGDNHATCSCLNQNMAYGVKPPKLGDYAFNLAESADYMFDHAIFNDCMANVDFCEQMVKETNPKVLAKAETTTAEHSSIHGYRTIADIMRALNPFTGEFYLETLHVARYTREMYCLFGGRHTHPSTIMPGGCSANITHQTMTDYYVRLMRYFEYVKRTVPMHDDLYDFFYEALPGYEKVGFRETNLVCWGAFDDPDFVDYDYRTMTEWGRRRMVTPGIAINGELVTTDLVEINLMLRILLGSSYFDGWENENTFVKQDPLGNAVDQNHPWNKTTIPKPQARDFTDKYSWVTSPRVYDKRTDTHVCCDTGGGPFARQWVTAKAGLVDLGFLKATGESILMTLPKTPSMPEMELEWKVPKWSNAIERDRARSYHQAYSALVGLYNLEKALVEVRAGRTKSWTNFKVPEEAVSVGFHEAARGVISHHMVIRDGKIANYQPYPPTPWNASPRDAYGTPGPYEDAVQNTPIFEENGPENFKGIDIMRAVRSFDPCLPCGVHMYLGKGRVKKVVHTPTGLS